MTKFGALIRSQKQIEAAAKETKRQLGELERTSVLGSKAELGFVLKTRELLIAQYVYLSAMADYIGQGGKSRGSFLVTDEEGDQEQCGLRFSLDQKVNDQVIQEVLLQDGSCVFDYRPVRPIPKAETWFEKVWGNYKKIYNSCDSDVI